MLIIDDLGSTEIPALLMHSHTDLQPLPAPHVWLLLRLYYRLFSLFFFSPTEFPCACDRGACPIFQPRWGPLGVLELARVRAPRCSRSDHRPHLHGQRAWAASLVVLFFFFSFCNSVECTFFSRIKHLRSPGRFGSDNYPGCAWLVS